MFVTGRTLLHQLMHFRRDIPPIPPNPHIATENRRECLSATASAERALSLILPYSNHTRAGSRSSLCKSHRNEAAIPDLAIPAAMCEQYGKCAIKYAQLRIYRLIVRIKAVVLRFFLKVK